jgi:hypothetical protein
MTVGFASVIVGFASEIVDFATESVDFVLRWFVLYFSMFIKLVLH